MVARQPCSQQLMLLTNTAAGHLSNFTLKELGDTTYHLRKSVLTLCLPRVLEYSLWKISRGDAGGVATAPRRHRDCATAAPRCRHAKKRKKTV